MIKAFENLTSGCAYEDIHFLRWLNYEAPVFLRWLNDESSLSVDGFKVLWNHELGCYGVPMKVHLALASSYYSS